MAYVSQFAHPLLEWQREISLYHEYIYDSIVATTNEKSAQIILNNFINSNFRTIKSCHEFG